MSHLFATKSLAHLLEEMEGENRLKRVLGPVQLSSLGVGARLQPGANGVTVTATVSVDGPPASARRQEKRDLSDVVAWLVAVSCSYVMNSFITFGPESGRTLRWRDYLAFAASGVAGARRLMALQQLHDK